MVFQREVCPTTGREHFQGYLELTVRQRLAAVKTALGDPSVHLEPRKGTALEAKAYCQKDESRKEGTSPVELGEMSSVTPGARQDLLAVKALLDKGSSELEIADAEFPTWARNFRAIERYKRLQLEVRSWKTDLFIICGATGTGKSRVCQETYADAYWKPRGNWWDGYDAHQTVIIDDFYGWLPWDLLLRLTDRYPLTVETKGGSVQFVAKRIVITSNKSPGQWYKDEIDKSPLQRRTTRFSWIELGSIVSQNCLTEMTEEEKEQADWTDYF